MTILTRNFNNVGPVTLSNPIGIIDTNLVVSSTVGFPSAPFTIIINRGNPSQEVCLVTSVAVGGFGVIRGYDNSSPGAGLAHSVDAVIELAAVANDFTEANNHNWDITRDDHYNYLRADGTRHDLPSLHQIGSALNTGLPTNSYPGDIAQAGSGPVAAADHVHGRVEPGMPFDIGMIFFQVGNVLPPGQWIPCDGRFFDPSQYPALYAVIGRDFTTQYISGSFQVPQFSNYFIRIA